MSVEGDYHREPISPLDTASQLRMPDVREMRPAEKVSALEDYLIETAVVEGEVSEIRLTAQRQLRDAEKAWAAISGWEVNLKRPSKAGDATGPEIDRAKAILQPDLWAVVEECRWLVPRCNEAIARTTNEAKRASRLYTFITGS